MTHEELLAKIDLCFEDIPADYGQIKAHNALRAVVELHKPENISGKTKCVYCYLLNWSIEGLDEQDTSYPCDTIQAIEKELK